MVANEYIQRAGAKVQPQGREESSSADRLRKDAKEKEESDEEQTNAYRKKVEAEEAQDYKELTEP